MAQAPERSNALREMPDWVPWVQAGFSAMLAVLFLVMVGKMRQQNSHIRELQDRVQGLENSRALDNTSGMEQQLRSTVERLQMVERATANLQSLSAETRRLTSELHELQSKGAKPTSDDGLPPLPPIKP